MVKKGYKLTMTRKNLEPSTYKHFETENEAKTAVVVLQGITTDIIVSMKIEPTEFCDDDPYIYELLDSDD